MRAIAHAVLLSGLVAALVPPFVHVGGWADAGLDAAPPGQLGVAHAQRAPDQRPLITTWQTNTAIETVTIPLAGCGMTVHWGDGAGSAGVSGTATHAYAKPGTCQVSVYGGLDVIYLGGHPDASRLVPVSQWSDISL